MRVTVLGGGSWGTTLAALLSKRNDVVLWAREPEVVAEINERHANPAYLPGYALPALLVATHDLAAAAAAADVLIVGVPTQWFRGVLAEAAPHVRPAVPAVSIAKGFEPETGLRMSQVIGQVLPGHPVAVLTGPNIAREVMAGQAAATVVASADPALARMLQEVARRRLFRVYTHHDVVGCEVAGALKNVVAIAAGISDGLGMGENARAMVISRGLAELTRLGVAMGGEPGTFAGLAGVGDLVATCVSPHSRNRRVGELLGRGQSLEEILTGMTMVAEGVRTVELVLALGERHQVPVPIAQQVQLTLLGKTTPADAYLALTPPSGSEAEPD